MDWNYYNDNDPYVVEWLRELIKCGQIPDGVVDDRSILDVHADDLRDFTQCHFFAGIGGWSLALQLAGWPSDKPVWTGSPPCQPFSVAGKDKREKDDRHLAPKFVELVGSARPGMLFGEQVASAAVFGKASKSSKHSVAAIPQWAWFDDLSDRLEASHYAVGATDIPSAGVWAPHIRQRTFYGAYDLRSATMGLADAYERECRRITDGEGRECDGSEARRQQGDCQLEPRRQPDGLADSECNRQHRFGHIGTSRRNEPADICDVDGLGNTIGAGLERTRWQRTRQECTSTERTNRFSRLADAKNDNGRLSDRQDRSENSESFRCDEINRMAKPADIGRHGRWPGQTSNEYRAEQRLDGFCDAHGLADTERIRRKVEIQYTKCEQQTFEQWKTNEFGSHGMASRPSAIDNPWRDADWLLCRDGKWRPVEPGTSPLAHGIFGRVGLLRGYGNAINPYAAAEFIKVFTKAAINA